MPAKDSAKKEPQYKQILLSNCLFYYHKGCLLKSTTEFLSFFFFLKKMCRFDFEAYRITEHTFFVRS